ncbi:proliferating cell nuclear antigen [Entomophthora muscae]|uniref:Proliferating cell nuclear antigen n=2 Tax=Entomophthora muscae TaxID=34485 RepID=A0ACC2TIK2_9FUNG|nr:proliferating cell nuclear antigen [Entomophthora muscae]KAJ9074509.1 proliferating cell nuclear antigen [Entomophthora muscae]
MLEAKLIQGSVLKKVVDALKELVNEANFDCNDSGIQLQAMDQSHVALVSLLLRADGFDPYRCDRHLTLGISLVSLTKILKCSGNDDYITIKADDAGETLNLTFGSQKEDRISEFDLKLMSIDSDHLGIPDTKYDTVITMSSTEFMRICRDLSTISDSVTLDVSKGGIRFSTSGEHGNGSVFIKPGSSVDEDDSSTTTIRCGNPVSLKFALKYLLNFTKATPLSSTVTLSILENVPILVEYPIGDMGYLQFYLAPKIDEE